MLAILAEKPSAARNFATALGGKSGTFNGENYRIVSARGHLLELMEPKKQVHPDLAEKYRIWDVDNLPWSMEDFAWKKELIKGTGDILKEIGAVFKEASEVCIATDDDPSGEGELLGFEVLQRLGWSGKTSRMYFPDESPKSIQQAFVTRKPLSPDPMEDGDYVKALTRQKWDYLSMQWTRIATCTAGTCGYRRVLRMGRLKSVMVSLVGDQEELVRSYTKIPYYEVRFRDENGNVFAVRKESAERVPQPDVLDLAKYHPSEVIVTSKETKRTAPRKLLDLAGISAALASKGFKPKKVLDIYQKMYEEDHFLSYPRTEDKKITPAQFNELLPLVDKICCVVGVDPALLTVRTPRKTHVDEKAGSHGALRPGLSVPSSLSALEQKYGPEAPAIYDLVSRSFLQMLCEDYVYEQQKGYIKDFPDFKGVSNIPVSMGFKQVFDDSDKKDENAKPLGKTAEPYCHEGFNRAPERPSIKWLVKRLESSNVGTGATRTSTIAEITKPDEKSGLMNEKKGILSLTQNGQMAHCLLAGCNIASVEVTEKLFTAMQDIGKFEQDPQVILKGIDMLLMSDLKTMEGNRETFLQRFGQGNETKGPAKKEEGIYAPTGQSVRFKRTWGTYTFSGDEVRRLLAGEEITIAYRMPSGEMRNISGILAEDTYKGRTYWGFIKTKDDAYCQGIYLPTGEHISFKKIWASHTFTEEEIRTLLSGGRLTLSAISKSGSQFTATGRLKKDNKGGNQYWGFQAESFDGSDERVKGIYAPKGKEVSFKRIWGGHRFTDDEVRALLAGESITITYRKKNGASVTTEGRLAERTYQGRKYWGFLTNKKKGK